MTFHLNIVSLKGNIFSGDVESVSLPAETGRMTVLKDHMSIVSPLTMGEVFVRGNKSINFVIGKGIFTISDNKAELLAEDLMMVNEIVETEVLEKLQILESKLNEDLTKEEKLRIKKELERRKMEVKVARKNNKKTQNS